MGVLFAAILIFKLQQQFLRATSGSSMNDRVDLHVVSAGNK